MSLRPNCVHCGLHMLALHTIMWLSGGKLLSMISPKLLYNKGTHNVKEEVYQHITITCSCCFCLLSVYWGGGDCLPLETHFILLWGWATFFMMMLAESGNKLRFLPGENKHQARHWSHVMTMEIICEINHCNYLHNIIYNVGPAVTPDILQLRCLLHAWLTNHVCWQVAWFVDYRAWISTD